MNIEDQEIEVSLNNFTIGWYRKKGYKIPTKIVQNYWNDKKSGKRYKHGKKERIITGAKIWVKVKDLTPGSSQKIKLICSGCFKDYYVQWKNVHIKKTDKCLRCAASTLKTKGHRGWWIRKLIIDDINAKCDISGETDKRFLVLHHLTNTRNGGLNDKDNFVILSANYHHAFHQWNGGTTVDCTPELYFRFKEIELTNK